jgi:hypothetical protein
MNVTQTLKVSGNSRPSVDDLAAALELLQKHGAPGNQLVTASTHVGGVWSLEVKWDPAAVQDAKERDALELPPEPGPDYLEVNLGAVREPVYQPRKIRDNPQA